MAKLEATEVDRLVGKRIQKKRKEYGYSAEKLSELLDISQQQLSRYERGTNKINVAHLVAIAVFLKTPISYFFADCMSGFDWNNDELDRNWQTLTLPQKTALIAFLETLRKV
ncbi:helix-turn-helix transcriptional regulator [Pasteurellaceae bacterium USgator11]|nr:helix-turn-helix transcriptional regulator [Pasteurellaceae bacterium USgator41]TNG96187.1 helix-turn-helix transcriptional regulator [Pasteurellaceae bacterium UScroc12]TNG98463.1 helix-turn-helix transcriptional regulator [Pasteurellaceae bacterium UScroc31]TNH03371.1 helix-turn-helix transcriptional regulator [Pasteurellaceae bacterium USgator11]